MQYTVFVANQGSLIRVGVPEHLAEMEGSDQEMRMLIICKATGVLQRNSVGSFIQKLSQNHKR